MKHYNPNDRNVFEGIDLDKLRKAVAILTAINHKLRQRIIDLLDEQDQMNVTDIYIKLRLEGKEVSKHLIILKRAGVVQSERIGKFVYYSLRRERLQRITKLVEALAS